MLEKSEAHGPKVCFGAGSVWPAVEKISRPIDVTNAHDHKPGARQLRKTCSQHHVLRVVVHPALCASPGVHNRGCVSANSARHAVLRFSGFRALWISNCTLSPRMFLARGTAVLEPAEQLWNSVSRAVEYSDALSAVVDLLAASDALVAQSFLSYSPVPRRHRDVLPDIALDQLPRRGCRSRNGFRV